MYICICVCGGGPFPHRKHIKYCVFLRHNFGIYSLFLNVLKAFEGLWLSTGRRWRCNSLQSSQIQVYLTPATSHALKFNPRRSKSCSWDAPVEKSVAGLPGFRSLAPWVCLQKKSLVMTLPRQPVTGRIWGLWRPKPHRTEGPRLKWHLLLLPWLSKPSGTTKRQKEAEKL